MSKTVYNTSSTKSITTKDENDNLVTVLPGKMLNVSDETARSLGKEWKEAQITEVSKTSVEPWELKYLGSLPPEMQVKVKFKTPKVLRPAATPELVEPAIPADEIENQKLGKAANIHVCPRGCGYQSEKLRAVRTHMHTCAPRPAMATE